MQFEEMELSAFLSEEPQRRRAAPARYAPYAARPGRGRRPRTRAGSMLVKIGFCFAVFMAAVFVQRFLLQEEGAGRAAVEATAAETDPGRETDEDEDVLGRLRFVEAGGARSVFATSQRWSMPINALQTELMEEETLLRIRGRAGDTVSVAAAGEVRAIARDEALGDYIRMHHGSDLESVYYNVSDIRVEVGQPLLARDTLGLLGDSGELYVSILLSGAPQAPAAYLDVRE